MLKFCRWIYFAISENFDIFLTTLRSIAEENATEQYCYKVMSSIIAM